MNVLAIITARGGSKRIPRKNIKPFCGKPIIAYSIEAAMKSKCFTTVMCSTDDEEIAEIARKYGAEVPFFRSAETSNDFATTADVLNEVICEYEKRGITFDYFCCLYPTAPFVNPDKIRAGYELMVQKNAAGAIPVVQFSYPIQRALKIEDEKIAMVQPEYSLSRSQDLMKTYHDAGQYYWFNVSAFKKQQNIMMLNPLAIITPEEEVQDIDTLEDWKIAEIKYNILHRD